jgi:predicted dehydrogenase
MIRWAILGAGKIAHRFVEDFHLMTNARLVAVASSDPERGKFFADQYGIDLVLTYEQLYASSEVDAIYIATTHNSHYDHAVHCLNSHKAVLCEKPITVNAHQCAELIRLSKLNNTFLMEAMWSYFLPAIIHAKSWIKNGLIGDVKVIQIDFSFPAPKNLDGRLYNSNLAGGALLDIGIYPIALAYYFTDQKPIATLASGHIGETGIDERVGILLEFGSVSASLYSSIVTRTSNSALIFGDKGYIKIPQFWCSTDAQLYGIDHELLDTFLDQRTAHGFIYEMQHANDMITQKALESPVMTHERSLDIQITMDEVRKQIGLRYPFE